MSTLHPSTKPSLNGVKIKTRKRVNQATAKYEPELFRGNIFEALNSVSPTDYNQISSKLDSAGNNLDYRRYGDSLFELLVSGGLIAPGGVVEDGKEYGKLSISLFSISCDDEKDELEAIRLWTQLIIRLTRRYKYLERTFSDTTQAILQYIQRYGKANSRKLALAIGILIANGQLPIRVLKTLQQEHLLKNDVALKFLTDVFRGYLTVQNMHHLTYALQKGGLSNLILFFPLTQRDDEHYAKYFEEQGMKDLIAFRKAGKAEAARNKLKKQISLIVDQDSDQADDNVKVNKDIIREIIHSMREHKWAEPEVVVLVWDAIMGSIQLSMRGDVIENQALTQVTTFAPVLEVFTESPKSEIALLKHIQEYCYNDARLTKHFCHIIKILYQEDVLSGAAILFWYRKGAKSQGKSVFLKQVQPFVAYLAKEDEEDEDESEEESDEE